MAQMKKEERIHFTCPFIHPPTCVQFHQHFMSSFCADIRLTKKLQCNKREAVQKHLGTKKCWSKMMMKLTPKWILRLDAIRISSRRRRFVEESEDQTNIKR